MLPPWDSDLGVELIAHLGRHRCELMAKVLVLPCPQVALLESQAIPVAVDGISCPIVMQVDCRVESRGPSP